MSDLSSDLAALKIDHDDPGSGSSAGKWIAVALTLAAATGLYLFAWPAFEARAFRAEVEFTEIASVSPAQASVTLTASGYVSAERTSKVAPKVPGRVKEVFVAQGQHVEVGQLLLAMDPTDERGAVTAAQSRVAAARARAVSARAQIGTAEAQLQELTQQAERERLLANQGISSTGTADDLEARVVSLRRQKEAIAAAAKAATAEATALVADVKVLTTSLDNLKLLAPISGTVMNKPPAIGEFVGPQPAGVSVDMGGISIADFATLVVEADVPEQRLHLIDVGGPCEIVLDAFPDRRLRGKTKEITPKVDRAKATVMIKVAFVDSFDRAMPDMAARVSFLSAELDAKSLNQPPKLIVPAGAIAERSGGKVVFTVEGDQVRMVPVELGAPFGRGLELIHGPSAGTRLVKDPPPTLADGQKVKEKATE